jgi:hypothetical protein
MTNEWDDLRKKAIRVRFQRILSQSGTPDDMRLAFLDLRFGKDCPQEVQDLAHFAAHRPERDRGRLLNHTSKLYKQLRKHLKGPFPLNVRPAYTDEQVASSLIAYCVSSKVLESHEASDLSQLILLVALYGLVSIHGCVFVEMDGSKKTPLTIRTSGGKLEIGCTAPSTMYGVTHPQAAQIFFNLPVFATSLPVTRTCGRLQSDLLLPSSRSDANTTIEITDDLHLRYLE